MTNPRKPFRINVGFIIHEEVGYSAEFPFEFDEVKVGDDLVLRDFSGLVNVGRTPQGLLVTGDFEGTTSLECARCLRTFEQRLRWNINELYAFNEKSVTDSGLIVPEDAQIDLAPLIRDYALLEVPISPLHDPNCKGLCPVCGQDRNVRDCGHRPNEDESPFSQLKKLL
ncbi:MAG TPA: DUF177 domain-containing protein [Anaerolineales bacterium]|nr:DUF177 domain-containing protein [Anaerolineales bacterium]